MSVKETLLACVCQMMRRATEFSFLWGVAVSAAIFLGQTDLVAEPNVGVIWVYILVITAVLDIIVILLERNKCSR